MGLAMIERARDLVGNDEVMGATHWPDHFAPMTWHQCMAAGCDTRVDPWDHNIRCPDHRTPTDHRGDDARARRREVAQAIVRANRETADA